MAFALPDLPYAHDALAAKGMSAETLEYHHDLHHNAYVTNGNKAIEGTEWADKSLEDIIKGTYDANAVAQNGIFNNISQLWNHNQFWEMMGPGNTGMPGALDAALVESFGSVDDFKSQFSAAGAGQFGSGWAWLVKNADGSLAVTKTENGVNPLCFRSDRAAWRATCGSIPTTSISATSARLYLTNFLDNLVNWENVAGRM